MDIDPQKLAPQIQEIVYKTGEFIRNEFKNFSFSKVEYKGDNDPVSYVDITAEKMLKEACSRFIPGSGFINEETGETKSENGYIWIIDPLDGTTNFTHGIPHFSISLALLYNGKIQMAYVYGIMLDEMFVAIRGKGATRNGEPIRISGQENLKTSVVVTGFPYEYKEWVQNLLGILSLFIDHSQGFRRFGSAALDLSYVACGRVESYFEFGLNAWDLAAGSLLVEEAGGKVTDFDGGDNFLFGKQIVSSNGHIHDEMLELINKCLPA